MRAGRIDRFVVRAKAGLRSPTAFAPGALFVASASDHNPPTDEPRQ